MATVKIGDVQSDPKDFCHDPDHNPPMMRLFEPGVYEHTCPTCGKQQIFTVPPKPRLIKDERNMLSAQSFLDHERKFI